MLKMRLAVLMLIYMRVVTILAFSIRIEQILIANIMNQLNDKQILILIDKWIQQLQVNKIVIKVKSG